MIFVHYLAIAAGGAVTIVMASGLGLVAILQLVVARFVKLPANDDDAAGNFAGRYEPRPSPASWHHGWRVTFERGTRSTGLRRWHIAAAVTAVGFPVFFGAWWAFTSVGSPGCARRTLNGCWYTGVLLELSLLLLLASIPVALLYLDRLRANGVANAEFIAFAVWSVPRAPSALIPLQDGFNFLIVGAMVVGYAGILVALVMRASAARTAIWVCASAVLLFVMSAGMLELPLGIAFDATLSAFAIGYGIYRIEWKRRVEASALTHLAAFGTEATDMFRAKLANPDRLRIRYDRDRLSLAAAFAITLLTIVAVARLIQIGQPVSDGASVDYVLLPGVVVIALAASTLMILTTISGVALQLRPFLAGLMWPALISLSAGRVYGFTGPDPFNTGLPFVLGAAATTGGVLWMMWYVFGPGRRRRASEQAVEQTGANIEATTAQVQVGAERH